MTIKYIDFSKYSSIKIGSLLPVSIIDSSDVGAYFDNGLYFREKLKDCGISMLDSLRIIGGANNLLVSKDCANLAMLGDDFNYISMLDDYVEMGANTSSSKAFLFFKQHDLCGLEFLSHLPGKIGGLCNMNAGMKSYEMKDIIHSININGEWVSVDKAMLKYRGRDSSGVIFATRFHKDHSFRAELIEVFKGMRANQPKIASCGSCFKNPPNDYAGRILEECGLKGFRINNVGFSEKHANFLVNHGGATFSDAIKLIDLAKDLVYKKSGIMLECEVKIC